MIKAALAKIDGLSVREKLILLSVLVVASLLIFIKFLWAPAWHEQQALQLSQQNSENLYDSLLIQRNVLETGLQTDPDATLRAENKKLASQLERMRKQLEDSLSRLVAPEDMPALLTELLAAVPELHIMEVIKLPTRKLQQGKGEDAAVLFSHRVRITVSGGYFDALRYIRQIEAEPSRLRLVSMEYRVEEYPLALMVLEIETLGLDARWFGV